MKARKPVLKWLLTTLGKSEAAIINRLSLSQADLEAQWRRKLARFYERIIVVSIDDLVTTGRINEDAIPFEQFLFEQAFAVQYQAIVDADMLWLPAIQKEKVRRLTQFPKGKLPSRLDELREWYDFFRKKGRVPPRQKVLGQRIKKAYLEKVKSVWEKYSRSFRKGDTFEKAEIVKALKKAAATTHARAQMTVETEGTRYYNSGRRAVYDESDDITHYLFVAIRDHATTKWCKTRTGLVYEKGALLDLEQPPCHWNCRSEILPLSPLNPRHKALIDDRSKARRNNRCEPLPKGWNRK